jgi:sigma-B regulation protein RsbU (phosphoserine phosphatase)
VLFGTLLPRHGGGYHVRLATGGHLPALLLDPAAGSVRQVRPVGGMFVGAVADATFDECAVTLLPGQTLLLYTDGITEARRAEGGRFGEEDLIRHVAARIGLTATRLVDDLADLVLTLRPDDDIALLALTADP